MAYRYKQVCFGGTFDIPIHKGHEAIIRKAFSLGSFCLIGLTTDDYAESFFMRSRVRGESRPFKERKANLIRFLTRHGFPEGRYKIIPLNNFYAEELLEREDETQAIIVSEETVPGARGINLMREDLGLKPLKIIKVETVLAEDGEKISSSRIRSGEITKDGKLVKQE